MFLQCFTTAMKSSLEICIVLSMILFLETSSTALLPYPNSQPPNTNEFVSQNQWNTAKPDSQQVLPTFLENGQNLASRNYPSFSPNLYGSNAPLSQNSQPKLGYSQQSLLSPTYSSPVPSILADLNPVVSSKPVTASTESDFKIVPIPVPDGPKTIRLPLSRTGSKIKVVHINRLGATNGNNNQNGISSDTLDALSKAESEIDKIKANSGAYSETDSFFKNMQSSQLDDESTVQSADSKNQEGTFKNVYNVYPTQQDPIFYGNPGMTYKGTLAESNSSLENQRYNKDSYQYTNTYHPIRGQSRKTIQQNGSSNSQVDSGSVSNIGYQSGYDGGDPSSINIPLASASSLVLTNAQDYGNQGATYRLQGMGYTNPETPAPTNSFGTQNSGDPYSGINYLQSIGEVRVQQPTGYSSNIRNYYNELQGGAVKQKGTFYKSAENLGSTGLGNYNSGQAGGAPAQRGNSYNSITGSATSATSVGQNGGDTDLGNHNFGQQGGPTAQLIIENNIGTAPAASAFSDQKVGDIEFKNGQQTKIPVQQYIDYNSAKVTDAASDPEGKVRDSPNFGVFYNGLQSGTPAQQGTTYNSSTATVATSDSLSVIKDANNRYNYYGQQGGALAHPGTGYNSAASTTAFSTSVDQNGGDREFIKYYIRQRAPAQQGNGYNGALSNAAASSSVDQKDDLKNYYNGQQFRTPTPLQGTAYNSASSTAAASTSVNHKLEDTNVDNLFYGQQGGLPTHKGAGYNSVTSTAAAITSIDKNIGYSDFTNNYFGKQGETPVQIGTGYNGATSNAIASTSVDQKGDDTDFIDYYNRQPVGTLAQQGTAYNSATFSAAASNQKFENTGFTNFYYGHQSRTPIQQGPSYNSATSDTAASTSIDQKVGNSPFTNNYYGKQDEVLIQQKTGYNSPTSNAAVSSSVDQRVDASDFMNYNYRRHVETPAQQGTAYNSATNTVAASTSVNQKIEDSTNVYHVQDRVPVQQGTGYTRIITTPTASTSVNPKVGNSDFTNFYYGEQGRTPVQQGDINNSAIDSAATSNSAYQKQQSGSSAQQETGYNSATSSSVNQKVSDTDFINYNDDQQGAAPVHQEHVYNSATSTAAASSSSADQKVGEKHFTNYYYGQQGGSLVEQGTEYNSGTATAPAINTASSAAVDNSSANQSSGDINTDKDSHGKQVSAANSFLSQNGDDFNSESFFNSKINETLSLQNSSYENDTAYADSLGSHDDTYISEKTDLSTMKSDGSPNTSNFVSYNVPKNDSSNSNEELSMLKRTNTAAVAASLEVTPRKHSHGYLKFIKHLTRPRHRGYHSFHRFQHPTISQTNLHQTSLKNQNKSPLNTPLMTERNGPIISSSDLNGGWEGSVDKSTQLKPSNTYKTDSNSASASAIDNGSETKNGGGSTPKHHVEIPSHENSGLNIATIIDDRSGGNSGYGNIESEYGNIESEKELKQQEFSYTTVPAGYTQNVDSVNVNNENQVGMPFQQKTISDASTTIANDFKAVKDDDATNINTNNLNNKPFNAYNTNASVSKSNLENNRDSALDKQRSESYNATANASATNSANFNNISSNPSNPYYGKQDRITTAQKTSHANHAIGTIIDIANGSKTDDQFNLTDNNKHTTPEPNVIPSDAGSYGPTKTNNNHLNIKPIKVENTNTAATAVATSLIDHNNRVPFFTNSHYRHRHRYPHKTINYPPPQQIFSKDLYEAPLSTKLVHDKQVTKTEGTSNVKSGPLIDPKSDLSNSWTAPVSNITQLKSFNTVNNQTNDNSLHSRNKPSAPLVDKVDNIPQSKPSDSFEPLGSKTYYTKDVTLQNENHIKKKQGHGGHLPYQEPSAISNRYNDWYYDDAGNEKYTQPPLTPLTPHKSEIKKGQLIHVHPLLSPTNKILSGIPESTETFYDYIYDTDPMPNTSYQNAGSLSLSGTQSIASSHSAAKSDAVSIVDSSAAEKVSSKYKLNYSNQAPTKNNPARNKPNNNDAAKNKTYGNSNPTVHYSDHATTKDNFGSNDYNPNDDNHPSQTVSTTSPTKNMQINKRVTQNSACNNGDESTVSDNLPKSRNTFSKETPSPKQKKKPLSFYNLFSTYFSDRLNQKFDLNHNDDTDKHLGRFYQKGINKKKQHSEDDRSQNNRASYSSDQSGSLTSTYSGSSSYDAADFEHTNSEISGPVGIIINIISYLEKLLGGHN